jgi:cyclopropane fatty-acyl-phospholipid synthase-like methyltransferase
MQRYRMSPSDPNYTLENPASVVKYHIYASNGIDLGLIDQCGERLELVRRWEVKPGSRVLEIGCGQGDCTIALAATIGPEGHVTGLDPAPLDYGQFMRLATFSGTTD